jgi:Amt family ammonium transporter
VALGIFADGTYGAGWNGIGTTRYLNITGQGVTGLLYGDTTQFITQILGATLMAAYAFGVTFAVFKIVNAVFSMRVSAAVELEGLDVPEFGLPAYPEDTVVGAEA